jgi:hypothetical protein
MALEVVKSLFKGAASALQRLKFNASTLGRQGAEIFEKSAEALQLERVNPLRGVDEWRLGQIFDDARDGIYADIAWLYNEIESVEPALVACCEMRESAASECGWLVKTPDAERTRGFDATLAEEQRDALLAEFGAVEDDLADLAMHLVSAFFRGAAHALPLWNADGTLAGFRPLDLWNFAYDRSTGLWHWNADASRDEGAFQPIPPGALVTLAVSSSRHVDHAALPLFIRAALGASRYGVWLDRFGIPPVAVIMPPNAEKGEQPAYMDLARKFARGGNGILPNGSAVTYGTEARAACPFPEFIRFQEEQIYTIGIGRVQSGANDSANLGGNAAGVVEAGFTRLVRRDARRIARAINDCVTRKVLARLFPGRPVLAQFAWDTEAKRTSREVLEDAGLAKAAGLAIDIDQVQELTGYRLEKAPETPLQGGFGGFGRGLNAETPLQTNEKALQIAPRSPGGEGEGSGQPPSQIAKNRAVSRSPVLEAFVRQNAKAAEAIRAVMENPTKEAFSELKKKLPDLIPEDPPMAAVIAKEMAKAAASAATGKASRPSHESRKSQDGVANSVDSNGMEHGEPGSGQGGRFVSKGEGGGSPREPETKPQHDRYGPNDIERLAAEPEKNAERAKAALDEVMRKRGGFVDKAAYRPECGWIRLDWGDAGNPHDNYKGGHGLAHIAAKHPDDLKHLPDVIAKGESYRHPTDPTKTYFVHGERFAVVASLKKGAKKTITEYAPDRPKDIDEIKNYPRAQAPGKKGG